jgi:hypothetical protein
MSAERRDNPCRFAIRSESINDSSKIDGVDNSLCGNNSTSSTLSVEYKDTHPFGPRVFISGIRVCMNKDQTRIKGFQINGKRIDENAKPVALENNDSTVDQFGGLENQINIITKPKDERTNCKVWKKWANCPRQGQIATGAIVHYEAGNTPRSITGIALQCRFVSPVYVVK